MFHCRADKACHLLEIQGEVSGLITTAHSLWNYTAVSPVPVTKELAYNKKLTVCQMYTQGRIQDFLKGGSENLKI